MARGINYNNDVSIGMPDNSGNSLFNMGAATMQRIDALIRQITYYKTILYTGGSPMHSLILRLQRALYTELYPYLLQEEIEEANKKFITVFKNNPIVNTGHSLKIPAITEQAMEDFELWTMRKLKEKNLLTPMGENPEDAMI